jgi:hypothetical protein
MMMVDLGLEAAAVDADALGAVEHVTLEVVVHIPYQDIVHHTSFLDNDQGSSLVASYL